MKRFGYPFPVELPTGLRYSPTRGWMTVRSWIGRTDQVRAIIPDVTPKAEDIQFIPEVNGQLARLEVTTGGSDQQTEVEIENVWELEANHNELSLWDHPKVLFMLGGATATDVAAIRAYVDETIQGTATSSPAFLATILANPTKATYWSEFLSRIAFAGGNATYYWPSAVLRNVLTGPRTWKYAFNFNTVAKLATSAQITASETQLSLTIPENRYWLTHFPRLSQMSNGKLQVIREWWEMPTADTWVYEAL